MGGFLPPVKVRTTGMPMSTGREGIGDGQDAHLNPNSDSMSLQK